MGKRNSVVDTRRFMSLWLFWKQFRRNRMAVFGSLIVIIFLSSALFAPGLAPYDPYKSDLFKRLKSPSRNHWLGTDEFGRDLLSRIIYGTRISFKIGTIGVAIAVILGVPLGLVAGFAGGRADNVIMRSMDVMLAFPGILLAIAIITILGPGLANVIVAVGLFSVPIYARLVRGSVLGEKEKEFVLAARALGSSQSRIMFLHILPNVMAPIIVQSTLLVATSLLTAASLSFLGMGAQPPLPEWGAMLSYGRTYMRYAPHVVIFPGVAIMLVVLGFNLMGDGLRDALDPRLRR